VSLTQAKSVKPTRLSLHPAGEWWGQRQTQSLIFTSVGWCPAPAWRSIRYVL